MNSSDVCEMVVNTTLMFHETGVKGRLLASGTMQCQEIFPFKVPLDLDVATCNFSTSRGILFSTSFFGGECVLRAYDIVSSHDESPMIRNARWFASSNAHI
jgi:hypothetical protein